MDIYSLEAGATYEHIFYEQQRDNRSILSRSGRAIAHDEEPSRHSNGWRISASTELSLTKKGRRCGGGAPLRICPDWKGVGMQWGLTYENREFSAQ